MQLPTDVNMAPEVLNPQVEPVEMVHGMEVHTYIQEELELWELGEDAVEAVDGTCLEQEGEVDTMEEVEAEVVMPVMAMAIVREQVQLEQEDLHM